MSVPSDPEELARELLGRDLADLDEEEQRVIERVASGSYIGVDAHEASQINASFGERLADRVAAVGGSWGFIIVFAVVLFGWMVLNSEILPELGIGTIDPFPYILLNLMLSTLAAVQAPVILMSQNRQEIKDRLRAENDYQVNLKAELEIRHLHEKMDHLINRQWERLAEIQEIQLEIMQDIARRKS